LLIVLEAPGTSRPQRRRPALPTPIRVGVLSRLPLTTFGPVAAFPDMLRAIQQGDKLADNTTAMGRPALHVRVRIQDTDIDLITAHFNSKLLTFPPNRFSPHDEGERGSELSLGGEPWVLVHQRRD
jgi:hypothetical protein